MNYYIVYLFMDWLDELKFFLESLSSVLSVDVQQRFIVKILRAKFMNRLN